MSSSPLSVPNCPTQLMLKAWVGVLLFWPRSSRPGRCIPTRVPAYSQGGFLFFFFPVMKTSFFYSLFFPPHAITRTAV